MCVGCNLAARKGPPRLDRDAVASGNGTGQRGEGAERRKSGKAKELKGKNERRKAKERGKNRRIVKREKR
jgi:hypothetical protein